MSSVSVQHPLLYFARVIISFTRVVLQCPTTSTRSHSHLCFVGTLLWLFRAEPQSSERASLSHSPTFLWNDSLMSHMINRVSCCSYTKLKTTCVLGISCYKVRPNVTALQWTTLKHKTSLLLPVGFGLTKRQDSWESICIPYLKPNLQSEAVPCEGVVCRWIFPNTLHE